MKNLASIYKINNENDLLKFLTEHIHYGFVYKKNIITPHNENWNELFNSVYKLRLKENLIKSGYGVCWDVSIFITTILNELKIMNEHYFIEYVNQNGGPTHTFVLFSEKGKWYWFEYSWERYRGIWEYASRDDALKDIIDKHIEQHKDEGDFNTINLYKIKNPSKRLGSYEFITFAHGGEKICLQNNCLKNYI